MLKIEEKPIESEDKRAWGALCFFFFLLPIEREGKESLKKE